MDGVVFKCMVILSEVSRLSLVGLILDSWHLHVVFILFCFSHVSDIAIIAC